MADPLPDFPYRLQNGPGNLPDADEVMADYDHIRDYLNGRIGNLSSAQLLIANASGQIVGRTISGDVTFNNTGVSAIAPSAVDTAELADNSVTNAKLADLSVGANELKQPSVFTAQLNNGAVTNAKLNLTALTNSAGADTGLTDTYQNLVSLTNPAAGTYDVRAGVSYFAVSGRKEIFTRFDNDTTVARSEMLIDSTQQGIVNTFITQIRVVDGSTSIRVQAKIDSNTAAPPPNGVNALSGIRTHIEAIRIA